MNLDFIRDQVKQERNRYAARGQDLRVAETSHYATRELPGGVVELEFRVKMKQRQPGDKAEK